MRNLSLMKLQGFLVIFCSLPFYSCEKEEIEDSLKNDSICEKKCINGYIPNGNVKTLTLPNELKVSVDEAGNYFHEDIVFPKQVIDSISKQGPMTRGAITSNHTLYWIDNFVPYEIAPGFEPNEERLIEKAIETITKNSYLTFVRGIENCKHGICFYPSNNGTYTNMIGKNPHGYNDIYLQNKAFCIGNVLHEVMHSLGFCHELSRNDRDKYVTVLYHNLSLSNLWKFSKGGDILSVNNFDYKSIMMYDSFHNSINGRPTVLTKREHVIPFIDELSKGDILALNYLYGPKIILTKSQFDVERKEDDYTIKRFKNRLYFLDKNGKSVALKYPRLLVYKTYSEMKNLQTDECNVDYSDIVYTFVPAGKKMEELDTTILKTFRGQREGESLTENGYQIMN